MKKLFILAAATMALVACDNDNNFIDEPVEARIIASIANSSLSRASETTWEPGDRIGITMVGRYDNYEYTTEDADGAFEGTVMYFRNKRDSETLTAYYPFTGTEGTAPAVVEVNTSALLQTPAEQAKYDFLFAKKENVSGSSPDVKLDFSHMMCKLTFVFKNGNDGTDVSKITSYTIDGLILDGTFNPANGVCAAKNVAPESLAIDLSDVTVPNGKSLSPLILFPQKPGTVSMRIADSEDQEYVCTLAFGDYGLVSGNNYIFNITVNKTGVVVNVPDILEWNPEKSEADASSSD